MTDTHPDVIATLDDAWTRVNALMSRNQGQGGDEGKVFRKIMSNFDILAISPGELARLISEAISEAAYAPMYFGRTGLADVEIGYFVYRYMTGWRNK